ncbi:dna repair protein-like protein rad18 [Dendryphion nanum]|uniref:Dna repair protein-like protein rad18 n=1 Tax=Dendryphion nanum TaxID=256645 RepID=A0A9P9EIK2_9PLEO|nr:dna repair protein-like protein rad18 [Dendryphion nanum]
MAPGQLVTKRPRAQTGDLGSGNGDVRSGRKSLNKRLRRSASLNSDEESAPPSESPSDSDEADQDGNDEDHLRATQRLTTRLQQARHTQNQPAENGIIEEIKCTNFMCHEQLTVTLGPLINFIIGHNGSGKSAVLTALTLCLGGKPTATNRGQSLKSFIKEGKEFSILSVRIKNQGSSAYKPDLYGRSIIVERHFTKTSSGFKLKDINGKIVSNKKQELEDILDAFALQIDNPMNVLTQDMARQFLNDSNPKDKYKFFLKGTQLQTLSDDYALIQEKLDETDAKIEVVKQDIEHLRKKAQEAMEKARLASSLEKMRERERTLLNQAAWAKVEEEEKELQQIEKEIENVQQKIDERTAEAEAQSEAYELANEAYSNANQTYEDRLAERATLEQQQAELKEKFDDVKKAIVEQRSTQRAVVGSIETRKSSIEEYETRIRDAKQRQAEADNGEHAQKMQELEEAKCAYDESKKALEAHERSKASLTEQLRTSQGRKREADKEAEDKRSEVRRSERVKRELEGGQVNWIDSFPDPSTLESVLEAIKKERRFREQPVGPVGRYVKLLKPEWSSILEKSAGPILNAFCVTSKADQNILTDIFRKARYKCPIYIGSGVPINTTGHEPEPGLDTWLRVLKFDNELVRSQMIINNGIDQIVLIKDRKQAEEFMHTGGDRRKNVRACFAMMDRDPQRGHSIALNLNSGAISLGPIAKWDGRPRMQTDKESQLSAAIENFRRAQEEYGLARSHSQEMQGNVDACQRDLNGYEKRKKQLVLQSQQAQERAEALEDEISAATPIDGQIEQFENSLEEIRSALTFEEGQYQDVVTELKKLNDRNKDYLKKLNANQVNIADLNMQVGKANVRAEKMNNRREETLRNKNRAIEMATAAEEVRGEWQQKYGEQIVVRDELTSQALQISPRVEVPRGKTSADLVKKRETLTKQREQAQTELGGSEDQLLQAANDAKAKHKDASEHLSEDRNLAQWLARSLDQRTRRWEFFRQYISIASRTGFTYLLSERQFRGLLKVDHKKQALDIQVQPDITVNSAAGRQTKTLSGGEKSFSTICLLLSLWEAMGSPIRCLDEFDVFMDNVNRAQSMKMIIQAARRAVGRQFIFITPQAMNDVGHGDDVKIIRMRDPERGQTTINLG